MKKKMVYQFPTSFTHITAIHEKKATLGGIFECHIGFQGKRVSGVEKRDK